MAQLKKAILFVLHYQSPGLRALTLDACDVLQGTDIASEE